MTGIGTVLNGYTVVAVASIDGKNVAIIATRTIRHQNEHVVSAMENGANNWYQGYYTRDFEKAWVMFVEMVLY